MNIQMFAILMFIINIIILAVSGNNMYLVCTEVWLAALSVMYFIDRCFRQLICEIKS